MRNSFLINVGFTAISSILVQSSTVLLWSYAGYSFEPHIIGQATLFVSLLTFGTILCESLIGTFIQKEFHQLDNKSFSAVLSFFLFFVFIFGIPSIFIVSIFSDYFDTYGVLLVFISLFFSCVQSIFRSILESKLKFKFISFVEGVSTLGGGGAFYLSIKMNLDGVKSIIVFFLCYQLIKLLSFVVFLRPSFSLGNALFGFGLCKMYLRNVSGFFVFNLITRNVDNFVVSKVYGNDILGVYAIAYKLMLAPITRVSGILAKVLFPTINRVNVHDDKFYRTFLKLLNAISLITFPFMLAIFMFVDDFCAFFIHKSWSAMFSLIVKALCLAGALQSLTSLLHIIFISTKNELHLKKVGLANFFIFSVAFFFGSFGSVYFFSFVYSLATVLYFLYYFFVFSKFSGLSFFILMKDVFVLFFVCFLVVVIDFYFDLSSLLIHGLGFYSAFFLVLLAFLFYSLSVFFYYKKRIRL